MKSGSVISKVIFVLSLCALAGVVFSYISITKSYTISLGISAGGPKKSEAEAAKRKEQKKDNLKQTSALFFGDMMLDRKVRLLINQRGSSYPFDKITDLLAGKDKPDFIVANNEGTFTNNPSKTIDLRSRLLQFTFDPSEAPVLKSLGFTTLSLANNHGADFGRQGIIQTKKVLTDSGIDSFGDFFNDNPGPLIVNPFIFFGYNQFIDQGLKKTIDAISVARQNYPQSFIIIYPHWGVEYRKLSTEGQQKLAHQFVDAGADLVVGSHPHVIEPIEIYRKKIIFYSLGNFIFDQGFSEDTQQGLAVRLTLDFAKDNSNDAGEFIAAHYQLIPISVKEGQAEVIEDTFLKDKILTFLAENSKVPNGVMDQIQAGGFDTSTF